MRWTHYGTAVMLTDAESIRDVFRGDTHLLHSGEANAFLNVSLGKNSVLVLDEEAHARQRRVLVPPLKGERMRAFFDAMRSATREDVRTWPRGQVLPMLPGMRRITVEGVEEAREVVGQDRRQHRLGRHLGLGRHGADGARLDRRQRPAGRQADRHQGRRRDEHRAQDHDNKG